VRDDKDINRPLSGWPLLVISGFIGGLSGILALLLSRWMARYGGLDSPDKHGISNVRASRLGGVLIVSYVLFSIAYQYISIGELIVAGTSLWVLALAGLFFSIGLFEDIKGTLSARLRLLVMLGAVAALLALNPDMLIKPVGVPVFDWFLENPWLATPIALLSLVFLPNAFNTADGANGLVAGISLITLLALGSADLGDLSLLLGLASISCLIFLVFNVMTAQFYLGDGGAYFLGALVGGALITASNTGVLPVWYLLSLIFYPSADFLWSICRRISRGQSPMASDELHLHNLVYARLRRLTGWQVGSNTMTGIGIAVIFAGLPYLAWLLASDRVEWLWVFLLQCLTYLGLWFLLRPKLAAKSVGG